MNGRATLLMPKLGLTMTEGVVARWMVAPGEDFQAGDILVVVETEKIGNDVEAPAAGRLEEVLVPEGEVAAVGEPLAHWSPPLGAAATPSSTALPPRVEPAARILATPLARRLADQLGVSLDALEGSGPRGRIRAADVEAACEAVAPLQEAEPALVAPSARQRETARRLTQSKRDIPHFYLATEADVGALLDLRDAVAPAGGPDALTVTPFLLLALASALAERPEANRVWRDEGVATMPEVDIGLAVATPEGLIVPVLRDVAGRSLGDVSRRVTDLAARARDGGLQAQDMGGGASTLSNAGMFDVTYMSSIISPGQSSILGVGSIRKVFRADEEGRPVLRREIGLVLSCDHRIFDGASGLMLLNAVRRNIENPARMLLR